MKKLCSLILCVAILCAVLPLGALSVSAEAYSGTCGGNLTWKLDTATGVLTISGEGEMDNYDGSSPWSDYRSYYRSYIKTVNIENGVTSIGNYAFYGCSNLTSITIPDSVTSIGSWAVSYCSSLTSVTIPDSVTSISNNAFYHCSSLTSITIPDSVTSIGSSAFYACSLTSITIPDGVTSIGYNAFCYCSSLTSITIPDSVTSIGNFAFVGCTELTGITVSPGNTVYHSAGNCLIKTATGELILGCKNGIIPTDGSVTAIGDEAFYNCSSLTSITIPNRVTSIGSWAFSGCSSLTSITIPNSVTSIGNYAFFGCSSLADVYYYGTAMDWARISMGTDNEPLTTADIHYEAYCPVNGHEIGEITVVTAPTCTQNGTGTYVCPRCGETVTVEIPAQHTLVGGVCTVCGKTERQCENLKIGTQTRFGETRLILKLSADEKEVIKYQNIGFVVTVDGKETVTTLDAVYDSFYNNGSLIAAESLNCTFISVLELGDISAAESVTVQGFYIAENGETVYGTARTMK